MSRYLINSVYRCAECMECPTDMELGFDEHAPPPLPRAEFCCVGSAMADALSPDLPLDLIHLTHSYLLGVAPSRSFLTTPPSPSQGTIQCFILETSYKKFELHLEVRVRDDDDEKEKENKTCVEHEKLNQHKTHSPPLPRNSTTNNMLKRNSDAVIAEGKDVFLLAAQCCNIQPLAQYLISSGRETSLASFLGALEKTGATEFTCTDNLPAQVCNELACVKYEQLDGSSPRHLTVLLPNRSFISGSIINQYKLMPSDVVNVDRNSVDAYENMKPVWHDGMNQYVIQFDQYRVQEKSAKNFKIARTIPDSNSQVAGATIQKTMLQFGRVRNNRKMYVMDYAYPLSPLVAFAICLSSIEGI